MITRSRDAAANFRTQLNRIIREAGLEPWPKLFHNLRATRETELNDQFPGHVVCKWIGNSEAVAKKHYLRTTDKHFEKAIETLRAEDGAGDSVGESAAISAGQGGSSNKGTNENRPEKPGENHPELCCAQGDTP